MMLAKVYSMGLKGASGYPVAVELDTANGLPCFITVGLPGSSLREARDRVAAAVRNSGFRFPNRKVTVNLAPAQVRKEGTHFDLPIALAALSASGQVPDGPWSTTTCFVGELALDGSLRPVRGVLAMALEARSRGFESMVVPSANAAEAAAGGMAVKPAASLREVAELLGGIPSEESGPRCESSADDLSARPAAAGQARDAGLCLSEVKGQVLGKRALEIAAAGGHNILFIGTPGVGKSMLARRLATLLPEPTQAEALEIARIHSLMTAAMPKPGFRPLRSPHHSATVAALVGGGVPARPGEVSLAHGGVLFLDELAEFPRESLEALRQPLEEGRVTVSRLNDTAEFPARFQLVAATNPCPCGYRGHPKRPCVCTPGAVRRYLGRLSGPLLDRIDLQIEMAPLEFAQWASGAACETSAQVAGRVAAGRAVQAERFARSGTGLPAPGVAGSYGPFLPEPSLGASPRAGAGVPPPLNTGSGLNAFIPHRDLARVCALDPAAMELLERATSLMRLSARSIDRCLKVARTVADLAASGRIRSEHLAEALQCRMLDRLMNPDLGEN